MIDWTKITGFDWDEGNTRKNEKHGVTMAEAEQLFFNAPLLVLEDSKHSDHSAVANAESEQDQEEVMAHFGGGALYGCPISVWKLAPLTIRTLTAMEG